MNAADMNRPSATNWDRIDALSDEQIDTTDVPPLDDSFFARAALRLPEDVAQKPPAAPPSAGGQPQPMDADQMDAFFRTLGLAVFEAQGLEYSLVSLFAATQVASGAAPRAGTIRQLMDTRYQQTLGQLVHAAAQDLQLNPELEELLRRALQERNWLVHRFFRQYAPAGEYAELGRQAIAKLGEVQALLAQAAAALHAEGMQRLVAAGISREQIEAGIQAATERYLAEELERV